MNYRIRLTSVRTGKSKLAPGTYPTRSEAVAESHDFSPAWRATVEPASATPKQPKIKPVTRWMVLYHNIPDGRPLLGSYADEKKELAEADAGRFPTSCEARAVRVRITPIEPKNRSAKR